MKLKTLKDLHEEVRNSIYDVPEVFERIKAEAVKWMRDIDEHDKNSKYPSEALWFIENFFNITGDDLK